MVMIALVQKLESIDEHIICGWTEIAEGLGDYNVYHFVLNGQHIAVPILEVCGEKCLDVGNLSLEQLNELCKNFYGLPKADTAGTPNVA